MKFLTKINYNHFLILTLVLFAVSIAGYFILQRIILNDAKESLLETEYLIKKQIAETGEIANIYPIVEVKEINRRTKKIPLFKEVFIKDEFDGELEPFLEYSNQIKINDSYYSIKIRQSFFESSDLVIIIALSIFVLLISAFGVSFFITKKLNKTIWSDFEYNLHQIEHFNFNENTKLNLLSCNIEEFDRLNKVIIRLSEKLKTDYRSLKELTENASHEIQTPLSIVLLNLEEFLQQDLNEEAFKQVVSAINAIKRLSKLNQSLILLAKIENKQYKTIKMLCVNDLIKQKVQEFRPLFETKKLKVKLDIEQEFTVLINKQLAEILIGNLLSNAVNHNIQEGNIQISIHGKELKICNSGQENSLSGKNIFKRFVKDNSESYGLGLSIVKKICETYQLEIEYSNNNRIHCFTLFQKL